MKTTIAVLLAVLGATPILCAPPEENLVNRLNRLKDTYENGRQNPNPPARNPHTDLNAMDAESSTLDAAFPDRLELPGRETKAVERREDIALYESVVSDGKPKTYFVTFKYYSLDPAKPEWEAEGLFRQRPFEAFNAENPFPERPLQMQGLLKAPAVRDRSAMGYRFIPGSTKDRGALAVFQNIQVGGGKQKEPADNCVGPIVWWGLSDRDAALKACRHNRF